MLIAVGAPTGPSAPPAGRIANDETPGSAAPSAEVACAAPGQLTNRATPVELFRGARTCFDAGNEQRAVSLLLIGQTYGSFDAKRVADVTAHQAVPVAQMSIFGDLPEERSRALVHAIRATMTKVAGREALCAEIIRLGSPTYQPDYMIQHGMGALLGGRGDGATAGFDGDAAWRATLRDYLECPQVGGGSRPPELSGDSPRAKALRLTAAIIEEDQEGVRSAIAEGALPNLVVQFDDPQWRRRVGYDKAPALLLAVGALDPWFLQYLLEEGGDPNTESPNPSEWPSCAFGQALLGRDPRHAQLLIDHGLALNRKDRRGEAVLDHAVIGHQYPLAGQLLRRGARPESGKEDGRYFFAILCQDSCLDEETWAERDLFASDLRARGYKLQCVWEGQKHCAPPTPRPELFGPRQK